MQNIYLFVPTSEITDFDLGLVPPQFISTIDSNTTEIEGIECTRISDIEKMNACFKNLSDNVAPKQVRDCINCRAVTGGAWAKGWDSLTANEKFICGALNVGTGAQILQAYPNLLDRIENSYNYLVLAGGKPKGGIGTSYDKSYRLQAIVFAGCKHILIPIPNTANFISLPELILTFLNTDPTKRGVTIAGVSWLDLYESRRLQGFYKGDGTTGLYDFFASTAGSEYENAGMKEIFAGIPNEAWVLGGFADVLDFSNYCLRYLDTNLL